MGQQCNYKCNLRCNYMQVFLKYKYNVKTCTSTISALYQMIHLNVSKGHII